jgi:predicted phage gp36 major capsid-like protein
MSHSEDELSREIAAQAEAIKRIVDDKRRPRPGRPSRAKAAEVSTARESFEDWVKRVGEAAE